MKFATHGLITSIKELQENGYLVHCITSDKGALSGFVNYSRSKKVKLAIGIGNLIHINYYGKEGGLGKIVPELIKSYANKFLDNQMRLFMSISVCECAYFLFGKYHGNGINDVHSENIFNKSIEFLNSCSEIGSDQNQELIAKFIIFNKILLEESGYGFQLNECVATGIKNIEDLIFMSPKSGGAVSKSAAEPYKHLLLPLPRFFITSNIEEDISDESLKAGLIIINKFLSKTVDSLGSKLIPKAWSKIYLLLIDHILCNKK